MESQTADPHDAIAAQLRDLTPRRAPDAPKPNEIPASSPEPAGEPPLRAVPLNDNAGDIRLPASRGRSGVAAILLAVCTGVAATMAWHAYGDEAKQRLSSFVPQLFAYVPMMQSINAQPKGAASQTGASQTAAAQPAAAPASAQDTSNEPATPAPAASAAPAAATPAAETPPAQAAVPPELMQSIEAMTREIDSLKQTVQQLQAGQQQMSQDIAKLREHGMRHKVAAQTSKPAPRPTSRRTSAPAVDSHTVTRYAPPPVSSQRPIYPQSYPQGAVQHDAYIPPPPPPRLPPQPGDSSAPRPPMPLQ
jgi:hypothetical protein